MACPSSQVMLLTPCGRATQQRFLEDIRKLMGCLMDNICLRTRKVGIGCKNGFFLYTWARIAELCKLPEWRIKQCAARVIENGWVDSVQPREKKTGADKRIEWTGLPSIKRVTLKYLKATGLEDAFKEAKAASKKTTEARAKKLGVAVKYMLTPITLLAKYRRQRVAAGASPPR
ncbi:hypothetical protein HWQ46_21695 [Shewanella sp. D64]|uniref:hypothetical protein n=1 Tax=unclassified Shewanella TaxID=196818 RepID=UPI0022BA2A4A|nr:MULTISPECIES: hypothetical protein [unclassified Shewanella]MEC4728154.1 hypothetical protein [Shewanella sp. D64]MEC4740274.1 hypothetical protein [Shewanella sp. E94]WBJ94409.1 hypothetical protein HWQ47_21455 [Shewanella sp. MTB7]